MNLAPIEARLIALLEEAPPHIPREQLAEMKALANAGEPGIALENYVTQLEEYEAPVSPELASEIESLARAMGYISCPERVIAMQSCAPSR